MKFSSLRNTMRFNIINVILLTTAIFSWTSGIATYEDGNGAKGYLNCHCGAELNRILDVVTVEKLSEMFDSFLTIRNVVLIPVYSGTLNCTSCETEYVSCKKSNFDYSYCITRTVKFKVISRKLGAGENYLKIIAKGPHAIQKEPLVIHIPLGTEHNTVDVSPIAKRSVLSYPKIIDIPIGGLKYKRRHVRQLTHCLYPLNSETSAIKCRIFPSSIKCVQKCAFGYTFKHGISRELSCNFKEDKWMPSGFKECQPFVDCSITLITGGSSTCTSMSLTRGPECKVECFQYEDKEAVPEASYSCDIDGNWTPKLPFCAVPKSDLVLAKIPKKKIHNETSEE